MADMVVQGSDDTYHLKAKTTSFHHMLETKLRKLISRQTQQHKSTLKSWKRRLHTVAAYGSECAQLQA